MCSCSDSDAADGYDAGLPCRGGPPIDREALSELYRRYGPVVHRRARVLLRDDDEARDAMQEVFARLVRDHERISGEPLRWMYRVTTNLCLNRLRRRRTHPVVVDPESVSRLVSGGAASGSEASAVDRAAVLALLERLGSLDRHIAVYYYLDQMTMDEVGEMVGRSRKTVGKRLARIQSRARAMLS